MLRFLLFRKAQNNMTVACRSKTQIRKATINIYEEIYEVLSEIKKGKAN